MLHKQGLELLDSILFSSFSVGVEEMFDYKGFVHSKYFIVDDGEVLVLNVVYFVLWGFVLVEKLVFVFLP